MRHSLSWLMTPIAHRGLHNKAEGVIENTLSAITAAITHNYAVEIDIQPSADFTPMVFHDETLDRLTEAKGPVRSISPAALKAVIFKNTSDHMPTLKELLEFVAERVPVIVEIKSPAGVTSKGRQKYARKIVRAINGYKGHVAVMSFDPRIITVLRKLAPHIPRGLVATDKLRTSEGKELPVWHNFQLRHLLWRRTADANFIAYDIRALPAIAPFLARTFFRMPLLTWTVRTQAEQRKAKRWADGMIFEGFMP